MAVSENKLGKFLAEVSNWQWDQFWYAERDNTYSSNEAMIFALIRSCAMQKMDAIKLSLNRLDGKLKTPIRIEYPKIYFLYPNAKAIEGRDDSLKLEGEVFEAEVIEEPSTELATTEDDATTLPSLSLRQTLTKMSDYPRQLPEAIVQLAQQTEEALREGRPLPDEIPLVKSVVAAHLLLLAQRRDVGALTEVFDQIDGKLAETLQILGEDIFITSYLSEAPAGARLNKDGVLQLEATQAQDLWANKLGRELER